MRPLLCSLVAMLVAFSAVTLSAQDAPAVGGDSAAGAAAPESSAPVAAPPTANDATAIAETKVKEIAEKVNQDKNAQEVSAGILKQIYLLAEKMESPFFHWVAFALMVTGVISFALQLVLGKLFVLTKLSLSPTEILSDAVGLLISLVGLVLTTQAAAQNSTFTQSPAAVLSASGVGAILGFMFFRWGTRQELSAADGRKGPPKSDPPKKS